VPGPDRASPPAPLSVARAGQPSSATARRSRAGHRAARNPQRLANRPLVAPHSCLRRRIFVHVASTLGWHQTPPVIMTSREILPLSSRAIATPRVAGFKSEWPRSNRNRWPTSFRNSGRLARNRTHRPGVLIDADHPETWVLIPFRFTWTGRSPRGRGSLYTRAIWPYNHGLIPARGGEASRSQLPQIIHLSKRARALFPLKFALNEPRYISTPGSPPGSETASGRYLRIGTPRCDAVRSCSVERPDRDRRRGDTRSRPSASEARGS
jgi:hypothetical protein